MLFFLEMKRTCGAWRMKQGFALWSVASPHGEVTLRFASWQRSCRFIEAVRLLLHIDEVDASLTKQWIYDILYSKDGDIMANDKLSEQSMDFAVLIINLVKQLKEQRERIYWLTLLKRTNFIVYDFVSIISFLYGFVPISQNPLTKSNFCGTIISA